MTWQKDIDELSERVINRFSVPEEFRQAVREAILLGLQRSTENWVNKERK